MATIDKPADKPRSRKEGPQRRRQAAKAALRANEAVRSAASFYEKTAKREDMHEIMRDLANL